MLANPDNCPMARLVRQLEAALRRAREVRAAAVTPTARHQADGRIEAYEISILLAQQYLRD